MVFLYRKELSIGAAILPQVSYCQLNMSQCEVTEQNSRFVVNVYNSLTRHVDKYVRVPVPSETGSYQVLDPDGESMKKLRVDQIQLDRGLFLLIGNAIPAQTVPIAEFVKTLPGRTGTATRELVFLANKLPPLGSKSYYVQPAPSFGRDKRYVVKSTESIKRIPKTPRADEVISNEVMHLFMKFLFSKMFCKNLCV